MKTVSLSQLDKRRFQRQAVYRSERMAVQIRSQDFEASFLITDFTPFGFGAVSPLPESEVLFENGDSVRLSLRINQQDTELSGRIVNRRQIVWNGKALTRIGIALENALEAEQDRSQDLRTSHRFHFHEIVSITCQCKDPSTFGQSAFFSVVNMSREGLLLRTSLRNKFLIPGTRHELDIMVPSAGSFREAAEIRHVRVSPDGTQLLVGCRFLKPQAETLKAFAEFSLIFSEAVSYKQLRTEGFTISLDSQALTVRTLDNEADFSSILELRRLGYGESGTLGHRSSDPLSSFTDELDAYSRHIVIKIGQKVVARSRIVFTEGRPERSALMSYPEFPEVLRGKDFVELSKMCTHPDYRDGPLLMRLVQEMFRVTLMSGVDNIVIFAREYLIEPYSRMGIRPHGSPFEVAGHKMQFMFGSCSEALKGRTVDFAPWAFGVVPLVQELHKKGLIELNPYLRLRMRLASSVRRYLVNSLEDRIEERLQKKKMRIIAK